MTDARETIAEIIYNEVLSTKNRDGMGVSNAAESILAAMPDIVRGMVKPLVWNNHRTGTVIATNPVTKRTYYAKKSGLLTLNGYPVSGHVNQEAAKQAAQDHHAAQLLAGLGL